MCMQAWWYALTYNSIRFPKTCVLYRFVSYRECEASAAAKRGVRGVSSAVCYAGLCPSSGGLCGLLCRVMPWSGVMSVYKGYPDMSWFDQGIPCWVVCPKKILHNKRPERTKEVRGSNPTEVVFLLFLKCISTQQPGSKQNRLNNRSNF